MEWYTYLDRASLIPRKELREGMCICYLIRNSDELIQSAKSDQGNTFDLFGITDVRTWLRSQRHHGVTHVIEDIGGLVRLVEIELLIATIKY